MINTKDLFELLNKHNINCFAGVPDSLLKDFCAYITDNTDSTKHTITANEGNAIALAAGHYLTTGNPALVYMQNSGIGNCVNPLLSLTDEDVYRIPLLMFIGWRGEPNKHDEPQHVKQGKVTDKLLKVMGIKYSVLPDSFEEAKLIIDEAIMYIKEELKPFAFIIKKGIFEKYNLQCKTNNKYELSREYAIETIIKKIKFSDIVVSTTGHISREVYEIRNRLEQSHKQDFLTVGSMGHASSIALGIALEKKDRNVYCFDGDGALLMHEGALTVNASKKLSNFKHIVLNNEAHDSVGGQPTANNCANIVQIALNSGYDKVYSVQSMYELENALENFISDRCTSLLEIKVKCGARADLGRPKEKPQENKKIFMENLKQVDFIYRNSIINLSKILEQENAKKILIFTGKKSYVKFKPIIENQLKNYEIFYYNNFSTNPKENEIHQAINDIKYKYDAIIAVGGGSVIDFAKAFKWHKNDCKRLIAIPTTAGTGSEATQFAVIYVNGIKSSIDNAIILPNYAIVDSQFVEHNPQEIKLSCALDAFCQAIESYWAVNSTPISREYAKKALLIFKDYLVDYINNSNNINSEKIMLASNYAGKAINISRTTAAHALSYKITSEYNIPHGSAVALSIKNLFKLNYEITEDTCLDKRGLFFVKDRLSELSNILNIDNIDTYFDNLFKEINFKIDIEYIDKSLIFNSINKDRLKNNPRCLDNYINELL